LNKQLAAAGPMNDYSLQFALLCFCLHCYLTESNNIATNI